MRAGQERKLTSRMKLHRYELKLLFTSRISSSSSPSSSSSSSSSLLPPLFSLFSTLSSPISSTFSPSSSLFHLKKIYLFIFWLHWVFVAACRLSLVAARGLLTVVASLVVEHGSRRAGFSSCGLWALEHRLSSCGARA